MKFNDKRLVTGGIALVSIVVIVLVVYSLLPRMMVTLTKAAPATRVSLNDSYVLGEDILARADGIDATRVNVFLLDKNGKPVSGKTAELTGANNIKVASQLSDSNGRVAFEIRSNEERQYDLSATYEGVPLGGIVTVTFRNVK